METLEEELIKIRRYLHQNAEVGFELPKTTAFVTEKLSAFGYKPTPCGRAGVVATVGKGKTVFLLRADMDALPIREESRLPFASKNSNMHACGHDLHTAMLLGAARILKEREGELKGTVKLLFQPAEELLEGAKDVLDGGVLKNPVPQGGMMAHCMTSVDLPVGAVVVAEGISAPAADFFQIDVKGKGCHGSAPWNGIDALTVAARIALGLEEIAARELSVSDPAVLTIGSLRAGEAGNVIADSATLKGTLRAFNDDVRAQVKSRMEEITKNIGRAFRVKTRVRYGGGCPTLVNDEKLSALAVDTAKKLLGEERAFPASALGGDTRKNSGGSEDFAYISQEIPTVMIAVAAGDRRKGYVYPLHHPKARFDEESLSVGAKLYAEIAIAFLARN